MPKMATITLNATLDRILLVPGIALGSSYDAVQDLALPGGKGLNVARTADQLGCELMTTGLLAGSCGHWIGRLLEEQGISERFYRLKRGESRTSVILVDPTSSETTVLHDRGPEVPSDLWPSILHHIVKAVQGFTWIALCGSCPRGLPANVYADLCHHLQANRHKVYVDTRDQWLSKAVTAHPYLIKCNQHEAQRVLRCTISTVEQARDAAQVWTDLGINRIVITLGDQGAVAVHKDNAWHVTAPKVKALSPVGSGDALMAGLLFRLAQGESLSSATQYGVALGAANTLKLGSARLDWQALSRLIEETKVIPIAKAAARG